MNIEFYADITDFGIGISFGRSHKCSVYFYNLTINFMFFMIIFRFAKVKDVIKYPVWTRD